MQKTLNKQVRKGLSWFCQNKENEHFDAIFRNFDKQVLRPLNDCRLDDLRRTEAPEDLAQILKVLKIFEGRIL